MDLAYTDVADASAYFELRGATLRRRTGVIIGDKKCDLDIEMKGGEYYGVILVDGEVFDMTATCGKNRGAAEEALSGMVARYQLAVEEESAFGDWARDVFLGRQRKERDD